VERISPEDAARFRRADARQVAKIAHSNIVWARTRRCTAHAFALGCTEQVNGVGVYKEHGTYCAFGTRKSDGSRAAQCFKTIAAVRKYARRG
jgi:hypothetical protein